MGSETDAELMRRTAEGDRRAFAALFDRHHAAVANLAFRYVGSRARAEEATQEVFVKLYRTARSYRPTASFRTFLFRVTANHCLNELRRGEYRHEVAQPEGLGDNDEAGATDAGGPDAELRGKELEGAVGTALAEMSERERIAFCLCRFEGMPYREIAETLSASEAAVKSLIHRATLTMARHVAGREA